MLPLIGPERSKGERMRTYRKYKILYI